MHWRLWHHARNARCALLIIARLRLRIGVADTMDGRLRHDISAAVYPLTSRLISPAIGLMEIFGVGRS